MSYLVVDKNGNEAIFDQKPYRFLDFWWAYGRNFNRVQLAIGSIEKMIGKKIDWDDEPVEY